MANRFIMTAFGKDRPGIVADVTKILYENGCNLDDTTMSMLADEFTLSLLFTSGRENIEELLSKECRRLELDKSISAFIRPLKKRKDTALRGIYDCVLHVEGADQAGIVYKTSQYLSENGLNIVDLKSTVMASPESGASIYMMNIHIQVPEATSVEQLEEGLSKVADELNVDISISS